MMQMGLHHSRCGLAAAVVEQELMIALKSAEQVMVMGQGEIVFCASPGKLAERTPEVA